MGVCPAEEVVEEEPSCDGDIEGVEEGATEDPNAPMLFHDTQEHDVVVDTCTYCTEAVPRAIYNGMLFEAVAL